MRMRWRAGAAVLALLAVAGPASGATPAKPSSEELIPKEMADRAVERVIRVWGRDWSRRAVVEVPADDSEAARRTGRAPADMTGMAAIATGDRIVIVPSGFARLTAEGRQVVLTHELTHVATEATTQPHMPEWLAEGFADYVAYRDVPLRTAAPGLATGPPPSTLPDVVRLARDYETAHSACRFIAERWGESRLVEIYRDAAAGRAPRFGRGFREAWRQYLRRELG